MRNGLLGAIAALAAGAGLAFGQGLQPLPGPGILDTPPGMPVGGGMVEPSPYGADGAPTSAAQGLFGAATGAQGLGRCWAKGEYLLWGVKEGPSRYPLIVSGTIPGGAVAGLPGSILLFGGKPFDYGYISGAAAEIGTYLPGSETFGVQADMMILPKRTLSTTAASGPLGIPVLGQQFINEITGQTDSFLASSLGNPGTISGQTTTLSWSAGLDLFANLVRDDRWNWNVKTGFKFYSLEETIVIDTTRTIGTLGQTFQGNPIPLGSATATEDKFQTMNRVYAWNIGTDIEYRWGRFALDGGFSLAIGDNRRTETVNGFSQLTTFAAGVPTTQQVPGGLLTAITNITTQHDNVLTVIPEVRIDLHYQVSRCLRIGMGYGAMYATNQLRPGNQIETVINPTLIPLRPEYGLPLGTARPSQVFRGADFWAQGVNWSVTVSY